MSGATVLSVLGTPRIFGPNILLVLALVALVAAACSSDGGDVTDNTVRGIVSVDTGDDDTGDDDDESEDEGDDEESDAEAAAEADDQAEVFARLEGTTTQPDRLETGDCFNEYRYRDRAEVLQQITTIVDCSRPHDKEVYFAAEHPAPDGAPFRGREEISQFARDECLDAFEDFVGEEYVLSQLEIGFFQPSYETWISAANERSVTCYVHPYEAGRQLQGSMDGIGF